MSHLPYCRVVCWYMSACSFEAGSIPFHNTLLDLYAHHQLQWTSQQAFAILYIIITSVCLSNIKCPSFIDKKLTASTVNGSCITSYDVFVQGIWALNTLYLYILWTLNIMVAWYSLHLSATMHNELSETLCLYLTYSWRLVLSGLK